MRGYPERPRTREVFTLDGLEHRGERDGHERLTCFVKGTAGLIVFWGTTGGDMRHILDVERAGYTVTIECDWIEPSDFEAETFHHGYWVWETDHFRIIS